MDADVGPITYSVDDIMALEPCYSRERVEELGGGRDLTAREIGALDIFRDERIWVLIGLLPDDRERRMWACDIAEDAWTRFGAPVMPDDRRQMEAIAVARLYATGEASDHELVAARDAASAAARDARAAARAAAKDAARYAASAADAAKDAASAAALVAARDAPGAARAAARAAATAAASAAWCVASGSTKHAWAYALGAAEDSQIESLVSILEVS